MWAGRWARRAGGTSRPSTGGRAWRGRWRASSPAWAALALALRFEVQVEVEDEPLQATVADQLYGNRILHHFLFPVPLEGQVNAQIGGALEEALRHLPVYLALHLLPGVPLGDHQILEEPLDVPLVGGGGRLPAAGVGEGAELLQLLVNVEEVPGGDRAHGVLIRVLLRELDLHLLDLGGVGNEPGQ